MPSKISSAPFRIHRAAGRRYVSRGYFSAQAAHFFAIMSNIVKYKRLGTSGLKISVPLLGAMGSVGHIGPWARAVLLRGSRPGPQAWARCIFSGELYEQNFTTKVLLGKPLEALQVAKFAA
ncbi:hypothetical protein D9757_013621 [Collybiopsis confluens]|uniref:Uncharacterized protein n=1 Tax=Collybiopsis confluens TaxID=2823264 RepID=A0A8H5CXV6_9AGAR|nr:hypothetical protein D9757_013621 [Collybiopsis confluens]